MLQNPTNFRVPNFSGPFPNQTRPATPKKSKKKASPSSIKANKETAPIATETSTNQSKRLHTFELAAIQ
jgi:hypothetical protein